MRDFLPADVRKREYVIGVIKSVYERYGFEPLETPAGENIETLIGKYGEEGNQLIFKILKRGEHEKTGEADLALRYDLTVPLARVVAQYQNELPKFFKRYQIQPVWRADRPARGRFREFYQCDVDVLGSKSMVVEAEICAAASDALVALGFKDFTIRLNHRQVLTGILNAFGVAIDKHNSALIALDKLDKIGRQGVEQELSERAIAITNVANDVSLLTFLIEISSIGKATRSLSESVTDPAKANSLRLELLCQLLGNDHAGLRELRSIMDFAVATNSADRIEIDPRLARGLSYYTGAIMEINVAGLPGSLGGGGRYDNLVGMFSGGDIPACGFSLGLERILVVMESRKLFPRRIEGGLADVMVTAVDEESIPEALKLANEIRAERIRVLFYPEVRKPAKQLFYADKQRIRSVIMVGPNELQGGSFRIRDRRRGEHVLPRKEIAATVRSWLDEDVEALKQRNEGFEAIVRGDES